MCGLVGVLNPNQISKVDSVFKDLLYVDVIRGKDSVGIYFLDDNKIYKTISGVSSLLKNTEKSFNLIKSNTLLLGHNRAATVGNINSANAHPFRDGNIIMAHNGTLFEWESLSNRVTHTDTDSKAICKGLSDNEDNPIEVLEKIDGAFALSWVNRKHNTLNLARNTERTLYYAVVRVKSSLINPKSNLKFIAWASESLMLDLCLSRHGFEDYEIFEVKDSLLHSIDISTLSISTKEFKVLEYFSKYYGYNSHLYYGGCVDNTHTYKDNFQNSLYNYGLFSGYIVELELIQILKLDNDLYNLTYHSELFPEVAFDMITDHKGMRYKKKKGKGYYEVLKLSSLSKTEYIKGKVRFSKECIVDIEEEELSHADYKMFLDQILGA